MLIYCVIDRVLYSFVDVKANRQISLIGLASLHVTQFKMLRCYDYLP